MGEVAPAPVRSRLRSGVAIGGALVVVALAIAIAARNGDGWPCEDRMQMHGDGGTGDTTEVAALDRAALMLTNASSDLEGHADQIGYAVHSSSGPDRYDPGSGTLYLDDTLVARFDIGRSPDGSYTVGTVETCRPDG